MRLGKSVWYLQVCNNRGIFLGADLVEIVMVRHTKRFLIIYLGSYRHSAFFPQFLRLELISGILKFQTRLKVSNRAIADTNSDSRRESRDD